MPLAVLLKINQVIDNKMLVKAFAVSGRGGMRRSLKTNSLVVVSDHTRGIYHDRWESGILHYTGMGLKGDQGHSASSEPNAGGQIVALRRATTIPAA